MEQWHMKYYPQGERQEIKTIFYQKGFTGSVLNQIVDAIVANEELWLETMLREEHGLPAQIRQPWRAALATFSAFVLCGLVPLLSYVIGLSQPFYWSCGLTALMFIAIGAIKSRWSIHSFWYSALTTLAVGGIAATLAFVVGYMFRL
jgi:VIT1/CCC1 family predicted Fe2+/Mn2+ transporter